MATSGSRKAIFAALAGNSLIAVTKFAAASHTGSSDAERGHSFAGRYRKPGTAGLRHEQAARPADKSHPFDYGIELYFWAFVVAILIFGVGAGVSFYEGITVGAKIQCAAVRM